MKAAILVDEINAVSQLHSIGIEGIKPWVKFYDVLAKVLRRDYKDLDISYHFYGAIPPKSIDIHKHHLRKRFFSALRKDGIHVHEGYVYTSYNGEMMEKGVDVMLSLDLFELSIKQYDLLLVFSADGDIVPAVDRAKRNGTKVVAILGQKAPGKLMRRKADAIVPLEAIVNLIDEQFLVYPNPKLLKERCVL